MTTASRPPPITQKQSIARRHTNNNREPDSPKALVFDPSNPEEVTEEAANKDNKATNSFEVPLPRWRNRVQIYEEPQAKTGYIFTLRLDRLGFVKNCKRRLGYDYKVLHVKESSATPQKEEDS